MDISGEFVELNGNFLQNLVLLLIAIGLTGFLIPIILKRIDDRKAAAQQRFQAELARQDKVIDAQVLLLDTLATLLWDYQLRAVEVLYCRKPGTGWEDLYESAKRAYDADSGPLLGKTRAEISKLLRLAPRSLYDEFVQVFYQELLPFDQCLVELMRRREVNGGGAKATNARCSGKGTKFDRASWGDLDAYTRHELAERVDQAFYDLAEALHLRRDTIEDQP